MYKCICNSFAKDVTGEAGSVGNCPGRESRMRRANLGTRACEGKGVASKVKFR